MIMALAEQHEDGAMRPDPERLVRLKSQIRRGDNTGTWSYGAGGPLILGGDRSNGQYAVLGLRKAQEMRASPSASIPGRWGPRSLEAAPESGSWLSYSSLAGQETGSLAGRRDQTMVMTEDMVAAIRHVSVVC